jgi:hypothetical protein
MMYVFFFVWLFVDVEGRREGGKEGRREGGKEGRREGGKRGEGGEVALNIQVSVSVSSRVRR